MLGGGAGRRGIGALLVSATVSRLADQSASIALVLLVIARTHNPRLAGLVVAAFTVPTLVTGPVIGAYLDRLKAKRALFAANQVTLAAALAGVAILAGHAPGTVLIALGLLAGLTTRPAGARQRARRRQLQHRRAGRPGRGRGARWRRRSRAGAQRGGRHRGAGSRAGAWRADARHPAGSSSPG
jgi:hypothetical protein